MTLPGASRAVTLTERVTRIFGVIAATWFSLAAAWGMFGIIGGGHYAAPLGCGITAENMLKWRIFAPYWEYTATAPLPAQYYCHHPFGCEWAIVPFVAIFGHHDFAVYAPAVLMSIATVWLLYDLGKRAWGTLGGAATAAGYAITPITLAYANFENLEVPTIFGCALFFWGHARMMEGWKKRHLLASVAGAIFATNGDWPGFMIVGPVVAWGLLRAFILPKRLTPPIRFDRYARWWALTAAAVVAVGLFYVALFYHWNKIDDLLGSASARSGGAGIPLEQILLARKHRIELMFPPPIILLGKLAVPLLVARLVVRRQDVEIYSLATLLGATVQYLGFKNGADVHIFWPHYYGLYFALALGQVAVTLEWLLKKLAQKLPARLGLDPSALSGGVVLASVVAFSVVLLPDAARVLRSGRETFGRFNEENLRPETDSIRVLRMVSTRLPAGATLDVHGSLRWSWHCSWALHGLHRDASLPNRNDVDVAPLWIGRASQLGGTALRQVASGYKIELIGDIVVVDRRQPGGPLHAYTFVEREPNPIEWYLSNGTEPVVTMQFDPYATWEWRTHLDQPAEIPTAAPTTMEEKRIAHNIAVASGDAARADALAKELRAQMLAESTAALTDGSELFGVHRIGGVSPRLEMYFRASTAPDGDMQFSVRTVVVAKKPLSFIEPDTLDREIGSMMMMPTRLWKKGFLYKAVATLYSRVGVEKYTGGFYSRDTARAPAFVGRGGVIDLTTIE